jgi:hypothetical protein
VTDFQSFPDAILENDDLQDEVISVVMTATANGSGLGDGIATRGMNHNDFFSSEEVCERADFLGEGRNLTDFELKMISDGLGGRRGNGGSPDPKSNSTESAIDRFVSLPLT